MFGNSKQTGYRPILNPSHRCLSGVQAEETFLYLSMFSPVSLQLVDFRTVVSQMLGLDASTSPLQNYEIINLLEALLHTHHHHHHLHHHVPWHCPAHAQIQDLPCSSVLEVSRSGCAEDPSPL